MPAPRDGEADPLAVAPTQDHGSGGAAEARAARAERPSTGWTGALLGRVIGSYRVLRQLGQGGMGAVFEAVHEGIGQRAAVKVLSPVLSADPELVQRFWSEARAVSRVPHPGLVKIFDFGQLPDGTLYLLMEYLEGETLRARMERRRLGPAEALRLGRQVAAALSAAHERGIAHRDLKPDNLFVVPDEEAAGGERAKVLDFGLAKVLDTREPGAGTPHATGSGTIMGTPAYMAPEQCRGLGQADGQADVYALGVLLFEALCGRKPFDAETPGEIMTLHLREPAPPLRAPGAPPELVQLIAEMLRKDPAQRPTMAPVAARLAQLGGGRTDEQAAPSPPKRPWAPRALGVLFAVVGALMLYASRSSRPPAPAERTITATRTEAARPAAPAVTAAPAAPAATATTAAPSAPIKTAAAAPDLAPAAAPLAPRPERPAPADRPERPTPTKDPALRSRGERRPGAVARPAARSGDAEKDGVAKDGAAPTSQPAQPPDRQNPQQRTPEDEDVVVPVVR